MVRYQYLAPTDKQAVASDGVINIFSDKHEAVSLFDAAFLAEIGKREQKNLAIEILRKLLEENIRAFIRTNVVKSDEYSNMLQRVMNAYLNGHLTNEEVIRRLIELAKHIKEGIDSRSNDLSDEEAAFYDALSKPEAIKNFYADETLSALTKELTEQLRRNITVDWSQREDARAHMRMLVKKLLRKYKYPPPGMDEALETVMKQRELWADEAPFESESAKMGGGQYYFTQDDYDYLEAAEKNTAADDYTGKC